MESEQRSESLELFYNTFVDQDLSDDINLVEWIQSLKDLEFDNLTEKQMVEIFYFIDLDQTGYIDCVDFVNFCIKKHKCDSSNADIIKLQNILNEHVDSHEFIRS